MDRINSTNVGILPSGKRGWQDKNVAAGIGGTQFAATYENDAQEELVAGFIERAGMAPAAGALQVAPAAIAMFTPAPVYVTASQNVTIPIWATRCWYAVTGAGGSAAIAAAGQRGGGGGAGGLYGGSGGWPDRRLLDRGYGRAWVARPSPPAMAMPVAPALSERTARPPAARAAAAPNCNGGFSGAGTGGAINDGLGDGADGNTVNVATRRQWRRQGRPRRHTPTARPGEAMAAAAAAAPRAERPGAGANGLVILRWLP